MIVFIKHVDNPQVVKVYRCTNAEEQGMTNRVRTDHWDTFPGNSRESSIHQHVDTAKKVLSGMFDGLEHD